jgi:penicillin-binding protein-related factor A (putative recombinase)
MNWLEEIRYDPEYFNNLRNAYKVETKTIHEQQIENLKLEVNTYKIISFVLFGILLFMFFVLNQK